MSLASMPWLSLLIWLPILGGVLCLTPPARVMGVRGFALIYAIAVFALSLIVLDGFSYTQPGMQMVEEAPWLPVFDIYYRLGVDGIAMPLILLTTFTTVLVVLAGWKSVTKRLEAYMASFLILEGLMIGVFAATDAILFYVYFEAMLVPMFLIIGIWGGERRVYATIKFFLYTFLGSVFMLLALLYLHGKAHSFLIADFHRLPLTLTEQTWIFLAFLAAFAVKVPMWPVHTWLPDAHVEAPTGGSVILAAILLKIGGYGFLRFNLPITPDASAALDIWIIAASLVAVVYVGFVALAQQDMKKLIAYSSIAHMGFVTLAFFIVFRLIRSGGAETAGLSLAGGMTQMISHGFISGALFFCVGVLYDRMHSRKISDYGGVINTMPWFGALFVLFALANCGLPATSGFVGEFLVVLASFKAAAWIAFLAALTLILAAAYSLWMVKRVVFGEVGNDHVAALRDLDWREAAILGVLAIAVLALGIWPKPLLDMMSVSLDGLVTQLAVSKLH